MRAEEAVSILKNLAKPESKIFGLVIPNLRNHYHAELVYHIEETAREHNAMVILRQTKEDPAQEKKSIQALLQHGVQGMIVLPAQGEYFNAEILKLAAQDFPLVLIDRYLKGIHTSSVTTNHVSAAKMAADYLFKLGHTHIALLSPPPQHTTTFEERIEGFVQAHLDRGILVDKSVWVSDLTADFFAPVQIEQAENDARKVMELLNRCPSVTALFAVDYPSAVLAETAVEQLGLQVPEDISIISFDGPFCDLSGQGRIPFTHMRQNEEKIGRFAVEYILQWMMTAQQPGPDQIVLDAVLQVGASTGPARRN